MRLTQLKITNFRAYREETMKFGNYTCLVGPNGAGKSTALTALRVFFRDTADTATDLQILSEEDFNNRNTREEIVITVTFEDLSDEAQKDLQHYYRNGQLIVSAVARWDQNKRNAEVSQYGEPLGLPDFAPFFAAEKDKTTTELQNLYETLRAKYSELPAQKTKPTMINALRAHEAAHPELLQPIRSRDQFYGFTKGESLLRKYVQWVFVPAVKDATSENSEGKKNALRALLDRTVRSKVNFDEELRNIREQAENNFRAALVGKQLVLRDLSGSISNRLSDFAHAEAKVKIQWDEEASKYVKIDDPLARVLGTEGDFEGEISRFGHGFQRSYLVALLQELAGCPDSGDPRLMLACEEPELHQHPPQARHLAAILEVLSEKNAQVITCSHSPHFVRGLNFEEVRMVRYERHKRTGTVRSAPLEEISRLIAEVFGGEPTPTSALAMKIEQTLQERVKEMFFAPALVLVEGVEDIGYVEAYIDLMDMKNALRAHGCHIVPTNGKDEMIRPLAIAKILQIPTFAIFDADRNDSSKRNAARNAAIMRLCGISDPNPFPDEPLRGAYLWVWPSKIGDTVRADFGDEDWQRLVAQTARNRGIDSGSLAKNQVFIGQTLCAAWEAGKRSPNLEALCKAVMSFAIRERAGQKSAAQPNLN